MSESTHADALLEIGTEELPPSFFYSAIEQLKTLAEKKLAQARLAYDKIETLGTPRRLVLQITKLATLQPSQTRKVRGPAKAIAFDSQGKPTPALFGFLKSQNAALEQVEIQEISGKPYVFVSIHEKGKLTRELLAEIFPDIIRQLSFPKSMRWNGNFSFGRPIRWLVALLESEIIPFEIAGVKTSNTSYGHRFLSQGPIFIPSLKQYSECLQKAFVIPDHLVRRSLIEKQAKTLAMEKSAQIYRHELLLDEVTLLVEYPTSFLGHFQEHFLSLPQEVLITVMQHHQRYFPLINAQGELLPYFIAVRNGNEEGLEEVRLGNEQVLQARFKDAQYFFETDRKKNLLDRAEMLNKVVFQKNLGTMKQKVKRLQDLVIEASLIMFHKDIDLEIRSQEELEKLVLLSKCDLTTQMVFELPELQGVMGKEYAKLEGYSPVVCQAILDHYLPRFQGDIFPETNVGALLGILDRIDTLVGSFGLHLEPSGSSDPLGLRRACTTLLQILIEKKLDLNLKWLIEKAHHEYKEQGFQLDFAPEKFENFLFERTETLWKGGGIRYDLFRAFRDGRQYYPEDSPDEAKETPLLLAKPFSSFCRGKFLEDLRQKEKERFVSFVQAWVRIFNILKSKEAQSILEGITIKQSPENPFLFGAEEGTTLFTMMVSHRDSILKSLALGDILEGFKLLESFQHPINLFFDKVLVMDKDPMLRKNRLLLLWYLQRLMLQSFGDLTQIVLD
jgi:glycyl-tRNA synthetase beta chain